MTLDTLTANRNLIFLHILAKHSDLHEYGGNNKLLNQDNNGKIC